MHYHISPNILIVTIRFIQNFKQIHRQGMEPPGKMSFSLLSDIAEDTYLASEDHMAPCTASR
jgi:hypothetical protein